MLTPVYEFPSFRGFGLYDASVYTILPRMLCDVLSILASGFALTIRSYSRPDILSLWFLFAKVRKNSELSRFLLHFFTKNPLFLGFSLQPELYMTIYGLLFHEGSLLIVSQPEVMVTGFRKVLLLHFDLAPLQQIVGNEGRMKVVPAVEAHAQADTLLVVRREVIVARLPLQTLVLHHVIEAVLASLDGRSLVDDVH